MLSINIDLSPLFGMINAILPNILGPLLFTAGLGIAATLAYMLMKLVVDAFRG